MKERKYIIDYVATLKQFNKNRKVKYTIIKYILAYKYIKYMYTWYNVLSSFHRIVVTSQVEAERDNIFKVQWAIILMYNIVHTTFIISNINKYNYWINPRPIFIWWR